MKTIYLILAILTAVSTHTAKPPAPATLAAPDCLTIPGASWKLLWHDEFDGMSLDTSKWSIGLPWTGDDGTNRHHNGQYASYIMDDDIHVRDGALHLTTQRRDVKNPSGKVYHYTQGMITTSGKFSSAYGYFEIRAKVPSEAGPGTWPAFWTLEQGWPPEMDIIEYWGSDNRIHQGTVTRAPNGSQKWESYHKQQASISGWHTFGMEWGPGYQLYNIDGHINNAIYGAHLPTHPHYILLNSGIESGRPPRVATRFPNDFVVDYVRVYARPNVPALLNASFEGDDLAPWGRWNEAAIVDYNARTGKRCLRVDGGADGGSSAQQVVYGLKPSTTYRLTGYAKTELSGNALLGVKEHGGDEARSEAAKGAQYSRISLKFTTGPDTNSATVYCMSDGGGCAFFDDIALDEVGK